MRSNLIKIVSPLEQFDIEPIQIISFFGFFDFSYTNSSHSVVITAIISLIFIYLGIFKSKYIPSYWQLVVELLYLFIIDIIKQQAGKEAIKYFPILFTTFIFILFSNLIGLIPANFTSTSHIIITLTLSLSLNLGFLLIGLITYGTAYLWFFVPTGTPKFLLPLIVLIEIISYSLRPFSLAIRLFANMMAGHTLLFILSSFVISLMNTKYYFLSILPFFFVLAVVLLEIGIAFLQAYVFVVLLSIYLNDGLHINH